MSVAATPAETPSDNFAAAFDLLARDEAASPPSEAPKEPAETPAAVPGDAAPATAEPPAEPSPAVASQPADASSQAAPAGPEGTEPPKEAPPASAEPTEEEREFLARLASLVKKAPVEEKPAETAKPAPAAEPAAEPPLFTPEEQEYLATYEKDWSEVSKGESLKRKAEFKAFGDWMFQTLASQLKPFIEQVNVLAERTHITDLRTQVNDYDAIRDQVIDWAGKQPTYLRDAYARVINQGTPEEIAHMIGQWRKETGQQMSTSAAAPAASPQPRKQETELPSATKQAVAQLAPVSSKRSAVMQGTDPSDFDGAFAAFADQLK